MTIDKPSLEQSLAIIGSRTSLHVAAGCQIAKELTAGHMRVCVGISDDRESLYSFQYAEPALAYAAMRLVRRMGWLRSIDHLRASMAATFTDSGGELSAQILLLMIFDQILADQLLESGTWAERTAAVLSSTDFPIVPIVQFFKVLLGGDFNELSLNLKDANTNTSE